MIVSLSAVVIGTLCFQCLSALMANTPQVRPLLLSLLTGTEVVSAHGRLLADQTIVIRAYSDDMDDQMLVEIQPFIIIMFRDVVCVVYFPPPNTTLVTEIEGIFISSGRQP
jgi:hypothetical protein